MDLEVRHLRVLVTVADEGSVSKAATVLGLSQPSLSAQLHRIERAVGAAVFERSPTGVRPTPFGRRVLARARTVLGEMEDLRIESSRKRQGDRQVKVLRIGGVMGGVVAGMALRLRAQFDATATEIEVHSHVDQSSVAVLQLLGAGRLDAAVLEEFDGHELPAVPEVRRMRLIDGEPVFVALSEHHRLADQDEVDLADLADESWVFDPLSDSGETARFRAACQRLGFEPRIQHHATEATAARGFVASGQCVSLAQPTSNEGLGIVIRALAGDPIVRRLDVAWWEHGAVAGLDAWQAAAESYLDLVNTNPAFSRWWAAHPEVHPKLA